MSGREYLGEFEQVVLLALLHLGEKGYGLAIRREILQRTGRSVSLGALYSTLNRLESKSLVDGFVNLGSQLTDSSHEERPIPLPRTPFPAENHRLRRMGLSSLLFELP